jgi:hypothetical protein
VPVEQVPVVAEVLADRADGVVAAAPAVLSATAERTAEHLAALSSSSSSS